MNNFKNLFLVVLLFFYLDFWFFFWVFAQLYNHELLWRGGFGVYSLAFTILSFVVVLSRLGLDEALVKVISDLLFQHKEGQAKNAYRKVFFLSVLNRL